MQHYEGSWGGFLIFIVDFPISLLSFICPICDGFERFVYFMAVVGSIWWYLIGLAISTLVRRARAVTKNSMSGN